MGFEKYVPQATPNKSLPKVTIRKTGLISFDAAAVKEFSLEKVTHMVLFFDKSKKVLGVLSDADDAQQGAIPVSRRRRTVSIKVPQFFSSFGLLIDDNRKFDVSFNDNEKMITIDLSAVKRRRGRRPKL